MTLEPVPEPTPQPGHRTQKVGEFIKEGIAAGIDLSKCDFQHVDRSNPDMMEASLKSIIRAEGDAEPGKAAHVASHLRMCANMCTCMCMPLFVAGKAKLVGECDIFGSYKQNDGSDALMMNMYHELKPLEVWLDKKRGEERSEAGARRRGG